MNFGDFFSAILWTSPAAVPLLLIIMLALKPSRPLAEALAPLAAAPAFLVAVFAGVGTVIEVPLLLGTRFGLTETTQVFLLFSAGLWLLAGLYARFYMGDGGPSVRFFGFFLATMCGNLGLILTRDVVGFYLFFILMSFASYGLVVHGGSRQAFRAGRVYLILVVAGEAFLLPGMILVSVVAGSYQLEEVPAAVAESPLRGLIFFLIFAGFGTKVSVLPLHFSLPLIYPAAPPPGAAVLSGPVIKAGLLGWLLFLPTGEAGPLFWGTLIAVAGLAAAFYGVFIGLTQENPKAVLAYSSISQMGWMTVGLGVGLLAPEAWPLALAAITVYAAHHALAKSSLFLGLGVTERSNSPRTRRLALAGLLVGALAIAGAPLTSGAVAKYSLKETIATAPGSWPGVLDALLQVGAVGTTLLMARFLFAVLPRTEPGKLFAGLWLPWAAQLGLITFGILALPGNPLQTAGVTLSFSTIWPVTLGVLLAAAFWILGPRMGLEATPRVPPGDILVPLTWLMGLSGRLREAGIPSPAARLADRPTNPRYAHYSEKLRVVYPTWLESSLRYWVVASLVFLALVLTLTFVNLSV